MSLESLLLKFPTLIQNTLITAFNAGQQLGRRGGKYREYREYFARMRSAPYAMLAAEQHRRLLGFLGHARANSPFYRQRLRDLDFGSLRGVEDLAGIPPLEKEDLRRRSPEIATIPRREAWIGQTGGTTGKRLEVFYTWEDAQERQAMLDEFRERFGYRPGAPTAWWSGKMLVSPRDQAKRRFWKTDYLQNIRYYSTFHINDANAAAYAEDLNRFRPEFFSGIPSSIHELARGIQRQKLEIRFRARGVFTTSETLIPEQMATVSAVFGCPVYDQYASSEGAPFITQCHAGRMHYEMLTGVIEIVGPDMRPARSGEALVTSFSTRGTPLVRYRIGDRMTLGDGPCACGSAMPVIAALEGRASDYVYSTERGRLGLGNLSNCVKHVPGVIQFQVVQDRFDALTVRVVPDPGEYTAAGEAHFRGALHERLGDRVEIRFEHVHEIPREASGKYRMVINRVHDQIEART